MTANRSVFFLMDDLQPMQFARSDFEYSTLNAELIDMFYRCVM